MNKKINRKQLRDVMDYTSEGHANVFLNTYGDKFVYSEQIGWLEKNSQSFYSPYVKVSESKVYDYVIVFLKLRRHEAEMMTGTNAVSLRIGGLNISHKTIAPIMKALKKLYLTEKKVVSKGVQSIEFYTIKT